MPKNRKNIRINSMAEDFSQGISIGRIQIKKANFQSVQKYEEALYSHRDEGHTFHMLEKGRIVMEIDFCKYEITSPSVVYMHPNQVHRIIDFEDISVSSFSIKNENIHPDYLKILQEIAPVKPLRLTQDTYNSISDTFSLCLNFSTQKSNKFYHLILKESCNTLVVLIASVFLSQNKSSGSYFRVELIAQSFIQSLEENYAMIKRPSEYAKILNISTHYLNECVKNTTGLSVSKYIQDRIILEAKRLLYHTDKSVKEIAFELGYDDYPYFSRLFTKTTGISALTFRNNRYD